MSEEIPDILHKSYHWNLCSKEEDDILILQMKYRLRKISYLTEASQLITDKAWI